MYAMTGRSKLFSFQRLLLATLIVFAFLSLPALLFNGGSHRYLFHLRGGDTYAGGWSYFWHRHGFGSPRWKRPTLDIVVSMYRENITDVARQLDEIRSLEPLQGLDVRTLVYVKDESAGEDIHQNIRSATGALVVVRSPNRGREGGTYLQHILDNWDDLGRHTIFIQASMHSFDDAKNKILDYFVPETGVLSLGYLASCSCIDCRDYWDSNREFPRLAELYSALNGELCPREITLSYLGQMLVSAQRIRSRDRKVYEHLRTVLESDLDHYIHSDPRQDYVFLDTPSEPYFGHTIERSYMVLWGCEDTRIAQECGGWEGLMERRKPEEPISKCQCLDRKERLR